MTEDTDAKKLNNMQSLHRAVFILKTVVASTQGMSLTLLAKAVGLSLSTTHRIANAMIEDGLLSYRSAEKVFVPGSEVFRLGREASRFFDIVGIARPFMEELAKVTGDSVFLSVIEGDDSVCVERVVGNYPIQVLTLDVGGRRPLGVGGSSSALFAALPDAQIERIIRDNGPQREKVSKSTTEKTLRDLVAHVRQRGYGLTYGQVVPGMGAVSICLNDTADYPVAALTLSALKERLEGDRLDWVVTRMRETAAGITKRL